MAQRCAEFIRRDSGLMSGETPMRSVYISLALSISLGAYLVPAQADTSAIFAKNIHTEHATRAAKQALTSLRKMYDARDKLKAFRVEYLCNLGSSTRQDPIKVIGILQKPNKMSLSLYRQDKLLGRVVSDGVTETFYDVSTNEYAQCLAPSSYDVVPGGNTSSNGILVNHREEEYAENVMFQQDALKIRGFTIGLGGFPLTGARFLLRTTTAAEIGLLNVDMDTVCLTTKTTPVSNLPIKAVSMSRPDESYGKVVISKRMFKFALAPPSNLPAECSEVSDLNTGGDNHSQNSSFFFDKMQIEPITRHFPNTVFAWSPPMGAQVYHPDTNDYTDGYGEAKVRLLKSGKGRIGL